MALPELLASTGNPQIDQIIQGVIRVFDLVFPSRILGCYLQGSCADGQITALSDIDMAIVFHGELTEAENTLFEEMLGNAAERRGVHLR
jgi:predicted nucleotidyltransferase